MGGEQVRVGAWGSCRLEKRWGEKSPCPEFWVPCPPSSNSGWLPEGQLPGRPGGAAFCCLFQNRWCTQQFRKIPERIPTTHRCRKSLPWRCLGGEAYVPGAGEAQTKQDLHRAQVPACPEHPITVRSAGATSPSPRTRSWHLASAPHSLMSRVLASSTAAGWLPASGVHLGDGCQGAVAARGGGRRKSVTRGGQSARRRGGTAGGGKEEQQEIAFQGSRGLCLGPGELQVPLLRIWVLAADGAARDEV